MDSRAVSPTVGKLLVSGLTVLYVASVVGLLLGGVVPDYRTATSDELADRAVAVAADHVDSAFPDTDGDVDVRIRTTLPASIRGDPYRLRVRDDTLVLDHPDDRLDTRADLELPPGVTVRSNDWTSGSPLVVRVTGPARNRTVRLLEGSA